MCFLARAQRIPGVCKRWWEQLLQWVTPRSSFSRTTSRRFLTWNAKRRQSAAWNAEWQWSSATQQSTTRNATDWLCWQFAKWKVWRDRFESSWANFTKQTSARNILSYPNLSHTQLANHMEQLHIRDWKGEHFAKCSLFSLIMSSISPLAREPVVSPNVGALERWIVPIVPRSRWEKVGVLHRHCARCRTNSKSAGKTSGRESEPKAPGQACWRAVATGSWKPRFLNGTTCDLCRTDRTWTSLTGLCWCNPRSAETDLPEKQCRIEAIRFHSQMRCDAARFGHCCETAYTCMSRPHRRVDGWWRDGPCSIGWNLVAKRQETTSERSWDWTPCHASSALKPARHLWVKHPDHCLLYRLHLSWFDEDEEMAADMVVDRADWTSFERQVGEMGMLMAASCQTETRAAECLEPERFTVRAPRFDLSPRMALDLRTGYDFSKEAGRLRAPECLRKVKPFLLAAFFTLHIIVAIADSGKRHQAMEGNGTWRTSLTKMIFYIEANQIYQQKHQITYDKLS